MMVGRSAWLLLVYFVSRSQSRQLLQGAKGDPALGRTNHPPNNNFYYYSNGNRLSNGDAVASQSFYDNRPFTVDYTTKLSDLFWCLFIALGWTVWMMHSIQSLRQSSHKEDTRSHQVLHTTEEYFPIFCQRYDSLLRVRGHVLDVIPNTTITDSPVARMGHTVVVDYVVERQPPSQEILQIRKYFSTLMPHPQVGFANIELLVLPDDPLCAMLCYDYEAYLQEEEGIQRVIQQEQWRRRRRRTRPVEQRDPSAPENSQLTTLDDAPDASMLPPQNVLRVVTDTLEGTNVVMDDYDDDWFGFEICRDWFDCSTMDSHQWKQLSLFFATLLVVASGVGCIQVVRRMAPQQRFLGWIFLWFGFLLLCPTAIWIHRVLMLCQRWSSEEPREKQGFIVQSSTGITTSHEDFATACQLPSCKDAMEDFCDRPKCSHPVTAFSYVVPELSGCYFVHYPQKGVPRPDPLVRDPSTSSISSISEEDKAVESRNSGLSDSV